MNHYSFSYKEKKNLKNLLSLLSLSIVLYILFFFLFSTNQASAQASNINWLNYPDSQGFAYIQYTGEKEISSQELLTLIENQGCTLRVLWIKEQRIGYHTEAIGRADFVNQRFNDSTIQTNTKITLQCTEYKETKEKTEQTQSFNLNETHIHWITDPQPDIQRNKQGQATIQYGGGSFYQLVSRLSTQGCNVHTLSIYNQEKKQTYTYSFENTNEQNQEFTNNYKQHIPKDTNITITCVDNCTIIYGLDLAEDPRERQRIQNIERCRSIDFVLLNDETVISYSECGDTWSDGIQQVFDRVPVLQDICKVSMVVERSGGGFTYVPMGTHGGGVLVQNLVAGVYVGVEDPNKKASDFTNLVTEIHEICHVHQFWYTFKEYVDYDYIAKYYNTYNTIPINNLWYETPMAQEFIDVVGFTQKGNGDWYIEDSNSIFNKEFSSYFNTNPEELSAQLCGIYLSEKIESSIEYPQYTQNSYRYITPQIEQWIEKYIVLPE